MVRAKQKHRPIRFIRNRLRVLRAERRWSQEELAARMGFQSKYRIWELENEQGNEPSPAERQRLSKLFRCPATHIFPPPAVSA